MLPKGALVENQVVVHTGRYTVMEDGEAETCTSNSPYLQSGLYSRHYIVENELKQRHRQGRSRSMGVLRIGRYHPSMRWDHFLLL